MSSGKLTLEHHFGEVESQLLIQPNHLRRRRSWAFRRSPRLRPSRSTDDESRESETEKWIVVEGINSNETTELKSYLVAKPTTNSQLKKSELNNIFLIVFTFMQVQASEQTLFLMRFPPKMFITLTSALLIRPIQNESVGAYVQHLNTIKFSNFFPITLTTLVAAGSTFLTVKTTKPSRILDSKLMSRLKKISTTRARSKSQHKS